MSRKLLTDFGSERDYMRNAYDSGGWFLVHRDLFLALPLTEAALLSCLINIEGMRRRAREEKNLPPTEWFRCTSLALEQQLLLKERAQQHLLRKLKRLKLIEVRMKGMPAKRYMQIHYRVLCELIVKGNKALGHIR